MPEHAPSESLYLNRELSWLAFNARVMHEATDGRVPLLERVKFLSIFSSNLDEYFMVRVGGLRRQLASGIVHATPDGLAVSEQLALIKDRVGLLLEDRRRCLGTLLEELAPHGVRIIGMGDLTSSSSRRSFPSSRLSRSTSGTRSRTSPISRSPSPSKCAIPCSARCTSRV